MARDSLRSTLDNLKVDETASEERPYLESALRRMGYTEAEIQERLAPAPEAEVVAEYRLVKPIAPMTRGSASPFEDLARGEVDFERVSEPEMESEPDAYDVAFEEIHPEELRGKAGKKSGRPDAELEDVSIDTFGNSDADGAPRTRVRVRRVRAGSRQEAEAKMAGEGRRIIKTVPVDIIERWGPGETGKGGR